MWKSNKSRRLTIFSAIITLIIALLIARLAWMQLLQGPQYKKQADKNRVHQSTESAPRGEIRDRNGAVLVSSRPSFAISVIPAEFVNRDASIDILAMLTTVSPDIIRTKLKDGDKFPYTPVRLKHDLDSAVLTKIEERKRDLPGVIIEPVAVRHYIYNSLAAHLFGYIGRINEIEYAEGKKQRLFPSRYHREIGS